MSGELRVPRSVLVTGGNRGIGLEVCLRLGALGYRVLLGGRNRELAEAAASSLRQGGAQVLGPPADYPYGGPGIEQQSRSLG